MNARLNMESLPSSHDLHNQLQLGSYSAQKTPAHHRNNAASPPRPLPVSTKSRTHMKFESADGRTGRGGPSGAKSMSTNAQQIAQLEIKPIIYEGKEINTMLDLLENFKLDTYQEAMARKEKELDDYGNMVEAPPIPVDDTYWSMIDEKRPAGEYYQHSLGDKLLYMKRVDKIHYDLVEADKIRKEKQLEEELARLREEREAAKLAQLQQNN